VWDNLRYDVNVMAKEYFENKEKEAQQNEIDEHTINRVPQEDEEE
jgi:hypothetical protein